MITLKESEMMKELISKLNSEEDLLEIKRLLDKQLSQIKQLPLSQHFDGVVEEYDEVLKKLAQ